MTNYFIFLIPKSFGFPKPSPRQKRTLFYCDSFPSYLIHSPEDLKPLRPSQAEIFHSIFTTLFHHQSQLWFLRTSLAPAPPPTCSFPVPGRRPSVPAPARASPASLSSEGRRRSGRDPANPARDSDHKPTGAVPPLQGRVWSWAARAAKLTS